MPLKDCLKKISLQADDRAEVIQNFKDNGKNEIAAVQSLVDSIVADIEDARSQLIEQGFDVALQAAEAPAKADAGTPRSATDIAKDLGNLFGEGSDLFGDNNDAEQVAAAKRARDKAELEARQRQSKMRRGNQGRVEDDLGSLFGHDRQRDMFSEDDVNLTADLDAAYSDLEKARARAERLQDGIKKGGDAAAAFEAFKRVGEARTKYAEILAKTAGAIELSRRDGTLTAAITRSQNEKYKWRVTHFNKSGFLGHTEHETKSKAVEEATSEGYVVLDPGALRRTAKESPGFSEDDSINLDKYARAVPLFTEALAGIDVANTPRREVFVAMIRPLASAGLNRQAIENMRPYFERFLRDVGNGTISLDQEAQDAPGTRGNLERDRGNADADNGLGKADVSSAGSGTGSRAGQRGSADNQRDGQPDSDSLPDGDASLVGIDGDTEIQDGDRTSGQPSDGGDGTTGRDAGKPGIQPDESPTDIAGDVARDSPDLRDRRAAQQAADRKAKANGVLPANEQNVRDTLPLLMPEQQDDVVKIERRFAKPDGHGMLLTNGTGTGKTYSGGGAIKRFVQSGRSNILVMAPSDGILDHWIQALDDLGVSASKLADTKTAGNGVVVTTYANAGVNNALAARQWDLIVTDESHKLSANQAGGPTLALNTMRAISNRPQDLRHRSRMMHADEWAKLKEMKDGEAKTAFAHKLYAQQEADVARFAAEPRAKVLFMSATPFATDKNVDYAEGYLFDYGKDDTVNGSRQDGRNLFMVANFGYRIRYHKLTTPDADVDRGVFEREFHEKLRRDGVLSGRHLNIEPDYERRFIQHDDVQGSQIDGVLDFLRHEAYTDKPEAGAYRDYLKAVERKFNYLRRMQLLEAIKARVAQQDIDKHLAAGRKVVVFHDYNVGGGFNPFRPFDDTDTDAGWMAPNSAAGQDALFGARSMEGYELLLAAKPEVAELNFSGYLPPVDAITQRYKGRAVVYNGTISKKDRAKAKDDFNKDGSGVDIIVVQSAAGEAGISLHDITGKHQRALINLGMPTRPTTALQEEGRTRREGSVSDALFHYYTIGTTWERQAFAKKIAEKSGTVENLALGNEARTIRDSFIDAYEAADAWEPSETDGKGGKERDRATAKASPYEIAKTHYFGRMATKGRRDQREGIDFYPTPEPLAFKMVEWAGARPYESILEPSAGDGSIARYFPEYSRRTIVEPSSDLLSRAQLKAVGAKAVGTTFENYHVVNKHHVIVMNPPFGSGGKTAFDHLAKAMTHLRPGGRIVALVPTGTAADKRFEALDTLGFHVTADVYLPAVTFEKAGTTINARILILDRAEIDGVAPYQRVNLTGSQSIKGFFDRLEDIALPPRPEPARDAGDELLDEQEAEAAPAPVINAPLPDSEFKLGQTVHAKKGGDLFVATATARVSREAYTATLAIAKRHNGWYSAFRGNGAIPGYQFTSEADRAAFLEDMKKPTESFEEPAYHGSPYIFPRFSLDHIGKGEGAQAYGWGLYFAGERAVAAHYRDKLARADLEIDGGPVPSFMTAMLSSPVVDQIKDYLADNPPQKPAEVDAADWRGGNPLFPFSLHSVLRNLRDKTRYSPGDDVQKRLATYRQTYAAQYSRAVRDGNPPAAMESAAHLAAVDWLAQRAERVGGGRLYKVEVPDAENLLAWDAPLSEQPSKVDYKLEQALRENLKNAVSSDTKRRAETLLDFYNDGGATAQEFYEHLATRLAMDAGVSVIRNGHEIASKWLRNAGIPGHRYLDGMSRQDGIGSYNYVIYDDAAIQVESFEESDVDFSQPAGRDPYEAWSRDEIRKVMPALRAELDRLDLKRVKLWQDNTGAEWQGMAFHHPGRPDLEQSIIIGASLDPMKTIHHEVIHILRGMNLFTFNEWSALETKAAKTWVEQYDIVERYPHLMPSEQIEEAIAEAFADAAATKKAPKGSLLVNAFNKIARLFKAFANAYSGGGFHTPEDIFGKIYAGKISARSAFSTGARLEQRVAQEQAARVPSRQARAHATTAMGTPAYIPDRRIWEELTRTGAPIWSRLRESAGAAHDAIDKARIKIQDRFLPVLRAQEVVTRSLGVPLPADHNAYLTETTFSGKVGRHLFEIDEDYTKPIIDLIASTKGKLTSDDVGEWLYARHAEERNVRIAQINPNIPDGGSGMMTADAQYLLAQYAAGPHAQVLKDIGALIDKLRERSLTLRENAGLITHAEAQLWRSMYKYYVPLKGFAETDHSEAILDLTGTGRRFNTRGPESKRALGRESEAFNPLQAAFSQAQEAAIRAEKNRVGQSLYNLAKAYPSPALWKVKAVKMKRFYNRSTGLVESRPEDPVSLFMEPNEIAVKISGEEHRVLFLDPRLAQAAGTVGADQMGWFVAAMSHASRYFSMINTMLDPTFVIRNAIRDMEAAQINIRNFGEADRNGIAKDMIKNWPLAFMGAYRGMKNQDHTVWSKYSKEFEQSGAKVSFWRMEQPEAGRADLDRRIRLAGGSRLGPASRFVRLSTRDNPILSFIERTNLAVDNAVRLAAYVSARQRGWSKQDAAALAKNLTVNFNRRGEWGATINAFWPFANAGIQGTQILFRAMTNKRMAKYGIGLIALGVILDAVNANLSEEDDDGELAYDKIEDWKNQTNLAVMLGPDSGNAARIWLPYGYNLFPYLGTQIGKVRRGVKEPGDALVDFAGAVFGSFSPLSGGNLQSVLTPTMLDPINEMSNNKDWLGHPIRPENAYADYGPDAYKYYSGVSSASKAIADAANRWTGGTIAESGAIDVSPEYIDHAFGFMTGGAGRFVGRTTDVIHKAVTGNFEEIEKRDIPIVRDLVSDTDDWLDRNRYYSFRDQVREARASVKAYKEVKQKVPQHIARVDALYNYMLSAEREIKRIKKQGGKDQSKVFLAFNRRFIKVMGPQGE